MRDVSHPSTDQYGLLLKAALAVFVGSMIFSVAGMLLLVLVPPALTFFAPYLGTLVVTPTWTYMAMLPLLPLLMYTPILGGRRMASFFIFGCLVGGASELAGTSTGFPFGAYSYTGWLGPKILGHVPYFIPPSWFAMSILSLDLAGRVVKSRPVRIVTAAVFMVLWDVSLDPAMNGAGSSPVGGVETFWMYPEGAFYYGMPLTNWLGWFGVSLLITAGYGYLGGGLPASHPWAPWIYLLNALFPLTLCLLYGLLGAFVAGGAAALLPLYLVHRYGMPGLRSPFPNRS